MKKLSRFPFIALGITVLLPIQSHAVKLNKEQKDLAGALTTKLVETYDLSKVNKAMYAKTQFEHLDVFGDENKKCLVEKLTTTDNYYAFKKTSVEPYIVSKTSQQINQDLQMLTPELVELMNVGISNVMQIIEDEVVNSDILEELETSALNHNYADYSTASLLKLSQFSFNPAYKDLRDLVPFSYDKQQSLFKGAIHGEQYLLWSMQQCSVEISEYKMVNPTKTK